MTLDYKIYDGLKVELFFEVSFIEHRIERMMMWKGDMALNSIWPVLMIKFKVL